MPQSCHRVPRHPLENPIFPRGQNQSCRSLDLSSIAGEKQIPAVLIKWKLGISLQIRGLRARAGDPVSFWVSSQLLGLMWKERF